VSRKSRYIRAITDGVPYPSAIFFSANEAISANDLICPIGGASAVSGFMPVCELLDSGAGVQEVVWVSKNAVPANGRGIALPWRLLKDIDTSTFSDGDRVYADYGTPGGYAAWGAGPDTAGTEPRAVGTVLYAHATAGVLILDPNDTVTPTLRVPDDVPFYLGSDRDFAQTYDSAAGVVDWTGTYLAVLLEDDKALAFGETPATGLADAIISYVSGADRFELVTNPYTAGGAAADTADILLQTGSRVTNDAAGGTPESGAMLIQTGDTDCVDAGGTSGASGGLTLGTGDAASTLGTSGASGDFTLMTGDSADAESGDFIIEIGAAGTSQGAIKLRGAVMGEDTPEAVTSGAIDVDSLTSYLDSSGGGFTATIAGGRDGQLKTVVMVADGGDVVINANINNWATITFDDVGDAALLQYDGTTSNWNVIAGTATLA